MKQKYWAAGFVLLIGLAAAAGSFQYQMGTLARMGPGYFPLLLGTILSAIGILMALAPDSAAEAAADAGRTPFREVLRQRLRPWGATAGGMLAFIVLGKYGGFLPATFALIFLAALGDAKNSPKACLLLAAGVTAFALLAFHYGLRLQFALFAWG